MDPRPTCKHCRRPLERVDGQWLDDAPRDRAFCPFAVSLTHTPVEDGPSS